ncbi:hypothetical protein SERLA73DRAFT_175525 [Serpula lacrymans var. lacrymans S7.3]|uniref:Peptidase C14 caspase domain-containing protein n=1 Tax=Serpula lacrymans var. lacrymans (strain S7.3) TaxID=936435 RepID=F8PKD2_SERL3|nr:hypothetical protein SERLA73DRAFT_175525 [Serpula lacrymans var. lacrymans S7.3]
MAITHPGTERKPKKKALVIGINYKALHKLDREKRPSQEPTQILKGSHNNARHIKRLLIETFHFLKQDIVVMLDKPRHDDDKIVPTQANIQREIQNLVDGARAGDQFFLSYSGHGEQRTAIPDGHEEDGLDEAIVGSDGEIILDNDLKKMLPDALPFRSHLMVIWDTCHSGTMLDLPYTKIAKVPTFMIEHVVSHHLSTSTVASGYVRQTFISRAMSLSVPYGQSPELRHCSTLSASYKPKGESEKRNFSAQECLSPVAESPSTSTSLPFSREPSSNYTAVWGCAGNCRKSMFLSRASVISISACTDSQSAFEYPNGDSLTEFFINAIKSKAHLTFKELVAEVNKDVHKLSEDRHREARGNYDTGKAGPCTCHLSSRSDTDSDEQDVEISSYDPMDSILNKNIDEYLSQ